MSRTLCSELGEQFQTSYLLQPEVYAIPNLSLPTNLTGLFLSSQSHYFQIDKPTPTSCQHSPSPIYPFPTLSYLHQVSCTASGSSKHNASSSGKLLHTPTPGLGGFKQAPTDQLSVVNVSSHPLGSGRQETIS